jgi:outer membrane receptor protein involved in Fe transport
MRKPSQTAGKVALWGWALASVAGPAALAQTPDGDARELEEIVVTAPKTQEPVRDIPGSVSAFSDQDLQALGAQSMADYVTRTPGVVFNAGTPGNSTVTVRGISTGLDQGQGTTAYFLNEVSLTDPGFSIGTPDVDTFDVDNVAILRGPQGTLFGSGSLGGAVNYQAASPHLRQFDARLQGTIEAVEEGGTGDAQRLMLNVPLASDELGVRKDNSTDDDATVDLAGATLGGAGPVTLGGYADSEGTTYEIRLASMPGGRFDHLIGAMRDDTDQSIVQFVHDPGSAAVVDLLVQYS